MCYLTREATQKDKSLKTHLLFTMSDNKPTETEPIWNQPVFLAIQKVTSASAKSIFQKIP